MRLVGENIYLKILDVEDVSQAYLNWMDDEKIKQFLESRWNKYTINDIKEYVKTISENPNNFFFGIYLNDKNEHIGNIKIGDINQIHKFGDIGLMIGNKTKWGKGYASEAIKLATKHAFKELNLNKVFAGIYENNIGSYKAFLKAGFYEAGRLKKHLLYKGDYVDKIIVEKCNDEGVL